MMVSEPLALESQTSEEQEQASDDDISSAGFTSIGNTTSLR